MAGKPGLNLQTNWQATTNRASQGGKPANEGTYFLYVTEVCRCSQHRKQNCTAILRLRDFVVGLGPGRLPGPGFLGPLPDGLGEAAILFHKASIL
jgi:hypothetical protein